MAELAQIWKNVFGNLAPVQEVEGGQVLVKVPKGSEMSFGAFAVMLEKVQKEAPNRLIMDVNLLEDCSLSICVAQYSPPVTEENRSIVEEDLEENLEKEMEEVVEDYNEDAEE